MEQNNNLSIEKGTITFWIRENKIQFNDNKITPIFSVNPAGGSIFIVKDDDNKLKVFYVVLEKGRIDLEYDVSNVDPAKKHMIGFTWSLEDKKLKLYFDGKVVLEKEIGF